MRRRTISCSKKRAATPAAPAKRMCEVYETNYACIAIVAVLLVAAFYSSWKVQHFAEEIFSDIDTAMEAIRDEDFTTARKALAHGADLCDQMRMHINHLLRTEDFTELEASLRAADGHLEMNAAEEAFGELRRAQVQVETMEWLARRII